MLFADERERREFEEGEKKLDSILSKYESSPYLLDPRSRMMRRWDVLIAVALVYTATVTPYEVAFLDTRSSARMTADAATFPIYLINLLVDVTFFVDLLFNFNLM